MIKTAALGLLLAFALSLVALGGSPTVSAASGGDKHLITLKASTLPSGQMSPAAMPQAPLSQAQPSS
jgi:hypothetical protein